MLLTKLKQPILSDLYKVDKLIIDNLQSKVPLIEDMVKYIIGGGGKRLRPLILLVSARACSYAGEEHIPMAAVIEFIHTATLLHDDVVDNSMLRRGSATANNKWSNEAAVLVGDFLYSRAFQLMLTVQNSTILQIIADASNTIAEGEVAQLLQQHNPEITEQGYLTIIRNKTAKLFSAAAEVGAVIAHTQPRIQNALAQYGLHLGTAYQIIDDLLDYQTKNADFGKEPGNDFAEGKPTMPLIYLLKHGNTQQKELAMQAIVDPKATDFYTIQQMILNSPAMAYSIKFAKREASLAKQAIYELADSVYRTAALDLADFVVTRHY